MAADPGKTEPATPKRREKVRKEGNVPKSQETTKTITILAGFVALNWYVPYIVVRLENLWRYFFINAATYDVVNNYNALFIMVIKELAIITTPILFFIAVSAYVTLRQQVGPLWAPKIFKFKAKVFNLLAGLKRMFFSPQTILRLVKTILFSIVIGYICFLVIRSEMENFTQLYYADASSLSRYILETGFDMVLFTLIPMIAISVFDLWYTFYQYEENIKMSKQEVKEEAKQSEGDPLIKQKQKQKMMQVIMNRMMQQVPKADVVITNPTHYAVALQYDPSVCPAPLVVAKGVDKTAEKIKTIARENGVTIRENRTLARSLYAAVEVGQPIPEDLYKAVASIIAEIWRLKGKLGG